MVQPNKALRSLSILGIIDMYYADGYGNMYRSNWMRPGGNPIRLKPDQDERLRIRVRLVTTGGKRTWRSLKLLLCNAFHGPAPVGHMLKHKSSNSDVRPSQLFWAPTVALVKRAATAVRVQQEKLMATRRQREAVAALMKSAGMLTSTGPDGVVRQGTQACAWNISEAAAIGKVCDEAETADQQIVLAARRAARSFSRAAREILSARTFYGSGDNTDHALATFAQSKTYPQWKSLSDIIKDRSIDMDAYFTWWCEYWKKIRAAPRGYTYPPAPMPAMLKSSKALDSFQKAYVQTELNEEPPDAWMDEAVTMLQTFLGMKSGRCLRDVLPLMWTAVDPTFLACCLEWQQLVREGCVNLRMNPLAHENAQAKWKELNASGKLAAMTTQVTARLGLL